MAAAGTGIMRSSLRVASTAFTLLAPLRTSGQLNMASGTGELVQRTTMWKLAARHIVSAPCTQNTLPYHSNIMHMHTHADDMTIQTVAILFHQPAGHCTPCLLSGMTSRRRPSLRVARMLPAASSLPLTAGNGSTRCPATQGMRDTLLGSSIRRVSKSCAPPAAGPHLQ